MSFGTWTPRYYPHDGKQKPSATTVLSLLRQNWGMKWVANLTSDYVMKKCEDYGTGFDMMEIREWCKEAKTAYKRVSREAMDIGSAVHKAIEHYLRTGHEPMICDEQTLAGFNAFLQWKDTVRLVWSPENIEIVVYAPLYAGRADLIATMTGQRRYLIDFKTSKGFYDEMALQLAAYRHAYELYYHDQLDGCGIVRLDKITGKPYFKDYSADWQKNYQMFELLCRFWHLR